MKFSIFFIIKKKREIGNESKFKCFEAGGHNGDQNKSTVDLDL